jgi:hypothetical protein
LGVLVAAASSVVWGVAVLVNRMAGLGSGGHVGFRGVFCGAAVTGFVCGMLLVRKKMRERVASGGRYARYYLAKDYVIDRAGNTSLRVDMLIQSKVLAPALQEKLRKALIAGRISARSGYQPLRWSLNAFGKQRGRQYLANCGRSLGEVWRVRKMDPAVLEVAVSLWNEQNGGELRALSRCVDTAAGLVRINRGSAAFAVG